MESFHRALGPTLDVERRRAPPGGDASLIHPISKSNKKSTRYVPKCVTTFVAKARDSLVLPFLNL